MSNRKTIEVEMWCCVDSCGDYGIGHDADAAREQYEEGVQDLSSADGFRLVKVRVRVPLPEPVELVGEIAEEQEAPRLTEVA